MNDAVIGLDAVTMVVSGKCPKQIEQRIEKRNKQGRLYLEVDKTKQNETYNVTIVLPSIIRPSNLKGFSLLDGKDFVAERLEEQNKDIRIQLITRQGTEVDQSLIDKEEQELWNEAIEEDTDDWGTDDIYLG